MNIHIKHMKSPVVWHRKKIMTRKIQAVGEVEDNSILN